MAELSAKHLVEDLSAKCHAALARVVPESGPYALLDFPFYANIGDSAIWMGSRRLLEAHHGRPPAYVSTKMDFSAAKLDAALPDGPIYMLGGGNFGDLYPAHHRFRFEIVRRYGDRVVHLPQSLHFSDPGVFEETKELARLGSFLMVRDRPGEKLAQELGFEPILVPDLAFCLGPQSRPVQPDRDLLVLKRTDRESTGHTIEGLDWGGEVPFNSIFAAVRTLIADGRLGKLAYFDRLADERVQRGFRLLSLGRAVATDRLHGHIMSLLLGIPHFVSDNSTGKLGAYVEAWSSDSPIVHRCTDLGIITRADVARVIA